MRKEGFIRHGHGDEKASPVNQSSAGPWGQSRRALGNEIIPWAYGRQDQSI